VSPRISYLVKLNHRSANRTKSFNLWIYFHTTITSSTHQRPQVFITQRDRINCIHEPLSGAFFMGPERLSDREDERIASGISKVTYREAVENITEICNSNPASFALWYIKECSFITSCRTSVYSSKIWRTS
jgi:hypothetical protein